MKKRLILVTTIAILSIPLFSDWKYGPINFGDLVLGFSLLLMTVNLKFEPFESYKVKRTFIGILGFLIIHITLHTIFNSNFNVIKSLYYFIKACIYLLFSLYVYNFYKSKENKIFFFKCMLVVFVVTILIGFVINIFLINGSDLPQRTIWTFTRQDLGSYRFRNSHIYRMRSFFSEPAHLGVYINTIFSVYLFKKDEIKISMYWVIVFIISSLLTFSFSAMAATALILIVFTVYNRKNIKLTKRTIIALILSSILITVVFRNQIYQTIIMRFYYIVTGIDTSSMNRLLISWSYIKPSNFLLGNGIGMTPVIWNNIAYVQSDLGIIASIFLLLLFYKGSKINLNLVLSFIVICFLKGGYLNASFWFIISIFWLFSSEAKMKEI